MSVLDDIVWGPFTYEMLSHAQQRKAMRLFEQVSHVVFELNTFGMDRGDLCLLQQFLSEYTRYYMGRDPAYEYDFMRGPAPADRWCSL
jgi:hypothetical protein